MKGSRRQRCSGQIVRVLTHKTEVSFQESPETEVSFQTSIVMDLRESARQMGFPRQESVLKGAGDGEAV